MSFLGSLLDPAGFTPHGFCLTWNPALLWLNAGADMIIFLSYLSIPASLIWLLRRRRDRTYQWVCLLFVIFILACATTHGLAILTLWVPVYGIEGLAKALTAAVSVTTACLLWILAPRLAVLLSPAQLSSLNEELSQTVAHREALLRDLQDTEEGLRRWNAALQDSVSNNAEQLRAAEEQLHRLAAERLSTQELLARTEQEIRASFDSATIGKVHLQPPTGRLLKVNEAFAAMLGYKPEDLVGRGIWDLAYPDDRPAAHAVFTKLLTREIDHWVTEKRLVRRDGVPVWVRISGTVVMDHAIGLPRLVQADIEDLDLRHDIQSALRTAEARLRLALDRTQLGIVEYDITNSLIWVNARSSSITSGELPAETWLALSGPCYAGWRQRIHPDDREKRAAALEALCSGPSDLIEFEDRALRNDGGWSSLMHRYAVVERDPTTGTPVRAVGIIIDETEHVTALAEARAAKENLEKDIEKRAAALAHRRLLLREVYHRMNNVLQALDRCFAMKAQQESGPNPLLELVSAQRSRACALWLAHAELMANFDVETFDIAPFLNDLCDAVMASGDRHGVNLHVEVTHLAVPLDYAIPMGLLITELLTNCVAHACLQENRLIAVTLNACADAGMALTLSTRSAEPPDADQSASFAGALQSRLVNDLVRQLGAELATCGLQAELKVHHLAG